METSPSSIRAHILSETARLFVQRGYDGISMREIAEACKLSKAGIYYHFKDKEGLFLALMMDNLERVSRLVSEARQIGGTRREQITAFARGLFDHMDSDQRALIRLANQEMGKLSAEIRAEFGQIYYARFIEPLKEIFAEGMRSGELRPQDPMVATWVLLGMLYPLFAPAAEARPGSGLAAAEAALNIFFEGMNAR
jgi:AcrR family transcriptional regulator